MSLMLCWWIAAALSGGSLGLLGVHIVGMRMPFLAVAMAHAALAGAVGSMLLGIPAQAGALVTTLAAAVVLERLMSSGRLREAQTGGDRASALIMSVSMALALLGIGLVKNDASQMLGMMWGNILFVTPGDLALMAGVWVAQLVMLRCFGRRLDTLAFSPEAAGTCGIPVRHVLLVFLVAASLSISVNLQTVGGLLLYSLLSNPASGALLLARTMRGALVLSTLAGMASALAGLGGAFLLNLPAGAAIAVASVLVYGLMALYAKWKH